MSAILYQMTAIIGGVITILIRLTLSDVVLGGVADAGTYTTSVGMKGKLGPGTAAEVYGVNVTI